MVQQRDNKQRKIEIDLIGDLSSESVMLDMLSNPVIISIISATSGLVVKGLLDIVKVWLEGRNIREVEVSVDNQRIKIKGKLDIEEIKSLQHLLQKEKEEAKIVIETCK